MSRHSILIADDDDDLVNVLTKRCRALDLNVDSACDAMTALGKIEEHRPELVILDVNMPSGNGLGICEMMANHAELCSIPVILLTGHCDPETIRRCHAFKAYYVAKCSDVWNRVEPLLRELLCLGTPESGRPVVAGLPPSPFATISIPVPN